MNEKWVKLHGLIYISQSALGANTIGTVCFSDIGDSDIIYIHLGDRWLSSDEYRFKTNKEKELFSAVTELLEAESATDGKKIPSLSSIEILVSGYDEGPSATVVDFRTVELAKREEVPLATYLKTLPNYGIF